MSVTRHVAVRGRGALAVAIVMAAAGALVITYLLFGGGSYKPLDLADPCKPRPVARAEGFEEISQQLLLSGLDGAACRLRVTREELALALSGEESRDRFAREHRISQEALEAAVRSGLSRAVVDAERAGRVSQAQASLLQSAVQAVPIGPLIDGFRTGRGLVNAIGDLLGG